MISSITEGPNCPSKATIDLPIWSGGETQPAYFQAEDTPLAEMNTCPFPNWKSIKARVWLHKTLVTNQ